MDFHSMDAKHVTWRFIRAAFQAQRDVHFRALCSDIRDRRLHWAEWNGLDGMLMEGETRSVTAEAQSNLRGLAGFKFHLNLLKL